ncbi:MAG: thiolase family protein, partial [Pygmaiobacter sp.]
VLIPQKKENPIVFDTDEYPKRTTSLEKLLKLKPIFADGTVTAGNASGRNDGASSLVIMSKEKADELELKPLVKILGAVAVGVNPKIMGIGPVPATKKLLKKINMKIEDFGLIEINEAFAAQYLACEKELGLDRSITNVNGSGISLGHPVGATGTRLITTLIYELRRSAKRYGLVAICAGGGMGTALILEAVPQEPREEKHAHV